MHARRFGLVRVRSPLLAESLLFSVPAGTEMVHFPALSSSTYGFSRGYLRISQGGFPHSEISGSKPVCGSPKLFAAYHVLHRLLAPRHPPYALSSLTFTLTHCICGRKKLPFVGYSVVKEQSGQRPPHNPRSSAKNRHAPRGGPSVAPFRLSAAPELVENAGLEPATSWLQTRRSPS